MTITSEQKQEISRLLSQGKSGSAIAKQLHIRKQDALAEVRKLTHAVKKKSKITVKGKGSQTALRKKHLNKRVKQQVKRVKGYLHPKTRFYGVISTLRRFPYPSEDGNLIRDKTNNIYTIEDIDSLNEQVYDLSEQGIEAILKFIDVKQGKTVSESYVRNVLGNAKKG